MIENQALCHVSQHVDQRAPTERHNLLSLLCILSSTLAFHLFQFSSLSSSSSSSSSSSFSSMDVSFSAKPRTLSLTSCPSFSPSKLTTIRRQFLGSSQSLRPSIGLHSRRKSNGLRDAHPPLVRASLDFNSILNAVAVVTFSAVSVVYWSHCNRKENARKVSQMPNLASSQLGRAINWFVESDSPGPGDLRDENFSEKYCVLRKRIEENIFSRKEEAVLQFQNSAAIQEDGCSIKTLHIPGSDIHDSNDSESIISIKLETIDPSVPPIGMESGVLKPLIFAERITSLKLEQSHEEIKLFADLPSLTDGSNFSPSSFAVNSTLAQVMEQFYTENELIRKGQSTSADSLFGVSTREDIYTFYEANANSGGQRTHSYTSLTNNSGFSKLRANSAFQEADLTAHVSLQTDGQGKRNINVASFKDNLPRGIKKSGEGTGFSSGNEIAQLKQKSNELLHELPHPNGVHINEKRQPTEQLRTYHRLLKEGRLRDCVELLEEMDRLGFLDMNKIYHGRFFDSCKSKRAVEEAFRFSNLIHSRTLSTYNMLMSVCASSQDSEGAFQVMRQVKKSGMKADCKLYTTLISTCAKCGKVEAMFEVFHGMVNAGVEPNLHTYGALIDGCAKAGQVAKAFGVYGMMRSKKVKPDRVIFNALISACGQSGAVDRAFEVVEEMRAEAQPIDPDHVTVGALLRACAHSGQVDRAREAYKMIHKYKIKGTPEVYTIALSCCSQTGEWEFARSVYSDMLNKGLLPDEMFLSALIDVAGHAAKLDDAFAILLEARNSGLDVGIISYSSLMGACSNAKNWQRGLQLYEDLKSMKLKPTVPTTNALITALCDGDQLHKAVEVLSEMNGLGLSPNSITYSLLLVASERKNEIEIGLRLFSQAEKDGIALNLTMSRCIIGMCFQRFEKACTLGEAVISQESGRPKLDNEWTSTALMRYRAIITAGVTPSCEVLSQVLGCLQLPHDLTLKQRLIDNIGVSVDVSRCSNLSSLIDGFGEYDPRACSLVEEAASLGVLPCISLKKSAIVVDTRKLETHSAKVYFLTVLKGLKHRLAAGAKLPTITILVLVETTKFVSIKGKKNINLVGRVGQAIAAMLRRLEIPFHGNESSGKIRVNGLSLRRWFQPKLTSPFNGKPGELGSSFSRLGAGISFQQRVIRTDSLSLD